MQFNLVNDQEQVAQLLWRGVAWRGVALLCMAIVFIGLISILGGACSLCRGACISPCGCFPRGSSGSSSSQRLLCMLGMRLRMSSWLLLGSAFGVVAFVCFPVFLLPPLPIQGRRSLSSAVFPLNSLFSVTGA